MIRVPDPLLPFLLGTCLAVAFPGSSFAATPTVEITGTRVLPPDFAVDAAGLPEAGTVHLDKWSARS